MTVETPIRDAIDRALRHSWFPVARVQDLETPKPATLLGERLVVYLTEDRTPVVQQRRCPHRGGDLSLGRVCGSAIACPYHGWEWRSEDGACARIPAIGDRDVVPSKAALATYHAALQWGHVWACLDEPAVGLPDPPDWQDLDLTFLAGESIPTPAGLCATTENFRDVAHFPFVHRGTMGEVPEVVEPLVVQRDAVGVRMTRTALATESGEWSQDGDSTMRYHFISPGLSVITYEYERIGTRVLWGAPCPVSRHEVVIFWGVGNDVAFRGASVADCLAMEYAVYLEDVPIVSSLNPPEVPFDGEAVEFSSAADRFTLNYRRAFREFADVVNTKYDDGAAANGQPNATPGGGDQLSATRDRRRSASSR